MMYGMMILDYLKMKTKTCLQCSDYFTLQKAFNALCESVNSGFLSRPKNFDFAIVSHAKIRIRAIPYTGVSRRGSVRTAWCIA